MAVDGIYKIQTNNGPATVVECKFSDGVGWTVIQKRTTGALDFNRTWQEYRQGFSTFSMGSCASQCTGADDCGGIAPAGPRPNCDLEEYWIGLENIHTLTQGGVRMRIDLQRYTKESGSVEYDNFVVGAERDNYRLVSVGKFKNDPNIDIGDSFVGAGFGKQGYSSLDKKDTNHIGSEFSTKDRDNDGYASGSCGKEDGSGWWFNRCSAVNLNGKHYGTSSGALDYKSSSDSGFDDGILWQTWTNNKFESLIGSRMMIGPKPVADSKKDYTGTDCQDIADQVN